MPDSKPRSTLKASIHPVQNHPVLGKPAAEAAAGTLSCTERRGLWIGGGGGMGQPHGRRCHRTKNGPR